MLEQYRAAAALEANLGTPLDPDNVFAFRCAVELDERDAFPAAACAELDEWGFAAYYVPIEHGGKLRSFEEFLALLRVVARRDLTVAIGHGKTFLGAAPIWVGGSAAQHARLAAIVLNHEPVALALTERMHGSDLQASEVLAAPHDDGFRLSGEKWLINNATRSTTIALLARTDARGGPRGSSLLMVEKSDLGRDGYKHLPRVKTHGIRGADISGIRFDHGIVPPTALVGAAGTGLEITLKFLQLTRTLCAALSLGAADTALRCALDFALGRKLYGDTVFAIPYAQGMLVDALLDLLICDSVAIAATRAIHVVPEQMSLWSAVVKYFVPTTVETLLADLAVVLGARHYLREGHQWGIFQKVLRDNAIVSLFDGSTAVNLQAIIQQLRPLAARRTSGAACADPELPTRLATLFSLDAPLPAFDPQRLDLSSRGYDDAVAGLSLSVERLRAAYGVANGEKAMLETILTQTAALEAALDTLECERAAIEQRDGRHSSRAPELFELAKRYCALHAAASCLHLWQHNRATLPPFFAKGEWLALCLDRLLRAAGVECAPLPPSYAEHAAAELCRLYETDQLFSIVPFALA